MSTLSFESFWDWLIQHPNCILRAGTTDVALFDDDDLHWHFSNDGSAFIVQVMRGKRLMGEIVLDPGRVSYVAPTEEQEEMHAFELISENEEERVTAYFFVLSHGFEEEEELSGAGRAVH